MTLEEMERLAILTTLKAYNGNRKKTAIYLGISIRNLRIKIKRYQRQGFQVEPPKRGIRK